MTVGSLLGFGPPPDWVQSALCSQSDPEEWYPKPGEPGWEAKRICAHCEVRVECLNDAIKSGDQHGIRGGLSAAERKRSTPDEANKLSDARAARDKAIARMLRQGVSILNTAVAIGVSSRTVERVKHGLQPGVAA